ncbi:MAG: MotA/TolQ/ExbB proton channel family protein [Polyangiaceae bacterium]
MQFDLGHILQSMGLLSRLIAGVLLVMAVASIGVLIDRLILLVRSSAATSEFLTKVRPELDAWNVDRVLEVSKKHPRSFMAKLSTSIVTRYQHAIDTNEGNLSAVERARRASERRRDAMSADLRKGLPVLATVGSIAPFVGLLGTVIGIITAFQGIASTGSGGLGAVSAGIAEALIETAFGLFVAIPAVLFFNYLNTRISSDEAALERFAGELLDEMEHSHGRDDISGEFAKAAE